MAAVHRGVPAQPERHTSGRDGAVAGQLRARVLRRGGVPHLLLGGGCHQRPAAAPCLPHLLQALPPRLPLQVVPLLRQVCVPALPVPMVDAASALQYACQGHLRAEPAGLERIIACRTGNAQVCSPISACSLQPAALVHKLAD